MNVLDNFTGSLICANCLNNAITAYIFINQTYFVRNRLNKCVSAMLDSLNKQQETNSNICIEIAEGSIMSGSEPAGGLFCAADDRDSSPPPPVDVLEDEFRLPDSADDSDSEAGPPTQPAQNLIHDIKQEPHTEIIAINGFVFNNTICSELLPPKKRKKWCGAKFTCTLCNKHFVSDYFLKRHILKHIPKKVECDVCSLQFQCKLYLYEHKKMVHLLKKAEFVFCKICGRCFTDERRLNYHQKRHNIRFCQLCDKLFRSQRCFDDHMQRHLYKIGTEMRKYRQNCSFCEKDCSNDNEFSLHVNKVHLQIKPYSCDMCERQFYTEYNLRSHQRLHSIYTREKCHLCNKVLSSRKLLVIHIRKHIGDTPFYCQICNQSFYSKSKAKKHMTLSHGGRFCCKFCKIALASKRALNDHVSFAHNSWI